MTDRDDVKLYFGPKAIEAFALVTLDEINLLRAQHGLAARTAAQLLSAVKAKWATLPNYADDPIGPYEEE